MLPCWAGADPICVTPLLTCTKVRIVMVWVSVTCELRVVSGEQGRIYIPR